MSRFPDNPVSQAFSRLQGTGQSIKDVVKTHVSLIRQYPMASAYLWIDKLWRPWYGSLSGRWDWVFGAQSLILLPLVVMGLWFWLTQRGIDFAFVMASSVIVYFWVISLAVVSVNRYMPPTYPFLGMFVGFGAQMIWFKIAYRRRIVLST
jgi:hypothetical protein